MARQDFYRQLARYADLVFILPACMGVGFGLGYLLDLWWGTAPWTSIVLTFLGTIGGFIQVFRIVTSKEE